MRPQEAVVALGYDPAQGQAPKVLAAGFGEEAKKILELARANHLHIHEDENLAQLLPRCLSGRRYRKMLINS
jgi:flagellar biosynthesis protein